MTDLQAHDGALEPVGHDIEAPEADAREQSMPVGPASPADVVHPVRLPLEADVADAIEQAAPAGAASPVRLPLEANEADAVEQAQVVEDPDEDYR